MTNLRVNFAQRTVPSLSGTFGIPTRLVLNPKMPKEPSIPSRSNALTADPDKTKTDGILLSRYSKMNKAQCLINRNMSGLQDPAIIPC